MIQITLLAISAFVVSLACLILAVIIFCFAKSRTHIIWACFNIAVCLWSAGLVIVGISTDNFMAIWGWKFSYSFAIFIAVIFYHVVLSFFQIKENKFLIFSYLQGFIFLYSIIFTNSLINNTFFAFNSIHYHASTIIFNLFFLCWCLITVNAFYTLFILSKKSEGIIRIQSQYLFWGMLLGFSGGVTITLPSYKIMLYPAFISSVLFYMIIMTFAVFKYKLMELTIFIKRSVIYILCLALISGLYLAIIFFTERYTQSLMKYTSIYISTLATFIIGVLFFPLRHKIQQILDRYFFKGTTEEIINQNIQLKEEITKSEKYKTLATLASGIAHEIKNPLTVIKTFIDKFPEKLNDKEFLDKFYTLTRKETDRINDMVHELLDYSKPAPLSKRPTNVSKLLTDTLDFLSSQFMKNNIKIIKKFDCPADTEINIDPNQIRQALLNILFNAIEAMPGGGEILVGVRVKGIEGLRSISTSNPQPLPPQTLVISIKDTGPGIDEKNLKHIFDPFFTMKDTGTGLGLAITQTIVEKHDGKIKVTSQLGIGTEFIIELPCKETL